MNSTLRNAVQVLMVMWCAMFLSLGCSSTKVIDLENDPAAIEKINREIDGRTLLLRLHSGEMIYADHVSVRSDSTSFDGTQDRGRVSIPTNTISRLQWNDHVGGIGLGFTCGWIIAGISFELFRPSVYGFDGSQHHLRFTDGVAAGALLGIPFGFLVGYQYIYEIGADSTGTHD